jgi:hypothetical protein
MPRPKKRPATIEGNVNENAVAEVNRASLAAAGIEGPAALYALRHSNGLQLVGAIAVTKSFAESLTSAYVRGFIKMRDEKLYVGLPYQDDAGVPRACSTLEEFCPAFLGVSYDTMRERASQLELLGDGGFDGAMRLGLTFKQLRAIEGSDAEVRKKVVAALERGARTEAIDLVDELLAERREKAKALHEAEAQLEAKDKVLDQKNRKIDSLTSATLAKPEWHQQLEKAVATVGEVFDKLQLACAEAARLTETIAGLEFAGVELESDLLALRAQIAVQFHGRSELWLDQGVALLLSQREQFVDALLSLAAKRLPEDVKARLFEGLGK